MGRWHAVGNACVRPGRGPTNGCEIRSSSMHASRCGATRSQGTLNRGRQRERTVVRGHVRKRRTWEFIVDIGPHALTGKRRQKSKSGFAAKKEAERGLREFIRHLEGGGDLCPERIRLADYLTRWIAYQRARGVRSLTLDSYEGYIRREISPLIERIEINSVRPSHVRAVLARMQGRGLSAATMPRRAPCSARLYGRAWRKVSSRPTP